MATTPLSAAGRTDTGKGVARKLRAAGRIPGVIYGHAREARALSLDTHTLEQTLEKVFYRTTVFETRPRRHQVQRAHPRDPAPPVPQGNPPRRLPGTGRR